MRCRGSFLAVLLGLAVAPAGAAGAQACTDSWTGAAGDGLWASAGNWSAGSAPGAGDEVCVPSGAAPVTVTLTPTGGQGTTAVHSLTLGTIAGQPVTLDVAGQSAGSATHDELDLAAGGTIESGAQLTLDSTTGPAILGGSGTLENDGEIVASGAGIGSFDELGLDLHNASSGTLTVDDAELSENVPVTTRNDGTVIVDAGAFLDLEGSFTNTGSVVSDGFTSLEGPGSVWTQDGELTGRAVSIDSAGLHDVSGAGQFTMAAGTNALTGTIPAGQTVTVLGANFDTGTATTLDLGGAPLVNDGTLVLQGNGFTGYAGPAITLQHGSLANQGTLSVSAQVGTPPQVLLRVPLDNAAGAQLIVSRSVLDADRASTIENDGLTTVQPDAALELTGGLLANEGTLANGGVVTLTGNGSPTPFVQDGPELGNAVQLLQGAGLDDLDGVGRFTIAGGTSPLTGTIPAGQSVTVAAATASLGGQALIDAGTLVLEGSRLGDAVLAEGTVRIAHGASAVVESGTAVQRAASIVDDGTLAIDPSALLALGPRSTLTLAADGTLAPLIATRTNLGVLEVGPGAALHAGGTLAPSFTTGAPPAGTSELTPIRLVGPRTGTFAAVAPGFHADYSRRGTIGVVYGPLARVRSLRATGRRIRVALSCPLAGACPPATISATVTRAGRRVTVAHATRALAAGGQGTLLLALDARGRALLARLGRLRAVVSVRSLGVPLGHATVHLTGPVARR